MHNKWLELIFQGGPVHMVNMEQVVKTMLLKEGIDIKKVTNIIVNNEWRDIMEDRYGELIALNAKLFGVIKEIERLVERQKIEDDRFVLSWDEYIEELNKENRRLSYNSLRLMHASN